MSKGIVFIIASAFTSGFWLGRKMESVIWEKYYIPKLKSEMEIRTSDNVRKLLRNYFFEDAVKGSK